MSGKLFIIATPIGNLKDISQRTKEALIESDLVLAEDTRVTIKLLNHLQIKKKMQSCHDYNEAHRLTIMKEFADSNGTIALVSDAGTPLVSDPGHEIVRRAIELGMQIIAVSGPSAFLLALVGSGLPCDRFIFEGFFPQKSGDRKKKMELLRSEERTLVFYVAPHDLDDVITELLAVFGNRAACLARELTKLHEEYVRGRLSDLKQHLANNRLRGECVLVVAGADLKQQTKPDKQTVQRELSILLERGEGLKLASATVAEQTGWSKSDLYRIGIEILEGKQS